MATTVAELRKKRKKTFASTPDDDLLKQRYREGKNGTKPRDLLNYEPNVSESILRAYANKNPQETADIAPIAGYDPRKAAGLMEKAAGVGANGGYKPAYNKARQDLIKQIEAATASQEQAGKKDLQFFQKSQGNVAQTILGTTGEVAFEAVKGAGSLVEGVVDLATYATAGVSGLFGGDKFAEKARNFAKENTLEESTKGIDEYLEKYSVLGDTSDAILQGLGQVGGIILTGGAGAAGGLGAAGTTALTTGVMGASSMGSGMSEAYGSGATNKEAVTYGLIKGVVDAGSELIFGGLGKAVKAVGLSKGLSSLDDVFAKKLSSKITNQAAKNLVELGVKASAEGVEEVLAGLGSAVGKKLTYMSKEELSELVKDEKLLEQFVVGAVTSGIAQSGIVPGMKSGSLVESNKTGRDLVTGLTENEQKVVDQEYNNRIKDKDLTKKQKNKIYEDVISDMEKADNKYVGKFLAADLRLEPPTEAVKNEIGPVKETAKQNTAQPTKTEKEQIAKVLSEEPTKENRKSRLWARFKANFLDKGAAFEDLSYKTKNRSLMEKWNYILSSDARAQYLIGNGANGVKSLNAIQEEVGNKAQEFSEYLYHKHNVDRMSLEGKFEGTTNKPVFGDAVTAAESREIVRRSEKNNPEFKKYAEDVYAYNRHLRQLLVDGGVISQETADLWEKMYPHYVPIRRSGDSGLNINIPLDTRKTGVNAPVKKATGGSRDILPLFDTMAQRTIQTYKAIAKNKFGVELKNILGSEIANDAASVDDIIDSVDVQDGLLQAAQNGKNPTFTVFENGERVTFEITEDMYDALKPVSAGLATTIKPLKALSSVQRGLLTEYNPVFMLTNAIKDAQDVLINSQHPLKTYAKMPEAVAQLFTKGYWYEEYMKSGGEDNTYFDKQSNTFETKSKGLKKILDLPPFSTISAMNNFVERIPRLAEYIASREAGKSVEGAMLDAARVTTNFAAGGDVTKFLNRNGATFLNASVQGAMQQVRNIRDAKANGLKGWVNLATKFAIAGIPALILNNLVWDDDEEYAELSDYVKQNYYVVGRAENGSFIRIPKGRALAVIQNAIEQISNAATGDDEADLKAFLELAVSNLAPNNPIDNNVISPIKQVIENKTWYGEDLVPTRLQDLPAAEQYDESTDSLSRWLGEKLDISPYKVNYLLDQYSGGLGDVVLPMFTPEAESGDNTLKGSLIAPLKDKFTTDAVFNNQNIADFYDKVDELTTNAKASAATDEDILKNKYMNAVNAEIADLYKEKREIQNSDLSDDVKYKQVRDIQERIVDMARDALAKYDSISYENGKEFAIIGDTYFQWCTPEDGDAYWKKLSEDQVLKHQVTYAAQGAPYASNGYVHYRLNKGGDWRNMSDWTKISDKDLRRQREVTRELGITPEEYWSETEVSYIPMKDGEYEYAYDNPESYTVAKAVGGYDAYKRYSKDLNNIKSDKDSNGKTISGSRKEKVIEYINGMDIDYGAKLILFKKEYNADDTYNNEIINYINKNKELTYDDKVTLLKELGFDVDEKGNITWD